VRQAEAALSTHLNAHRPAGRSTFDLFGIVKRIVDTKAQFRSLAGPGCQSPLLGNRERHFDAQVPFRESIPLPLDLSNRLLILTNISVNANTYKARYDSE
jgi:hypothetical protein